MREGHDIEGRLANVSAAVLVGGASSRMGRDKATLEVAGVALADRATTLLSGVFVDVLRVGGPAVDDPVARFVPDLPSDAPRCALRGIATALENARAERVFVLATDMPLVTLDLILGLTAWPEHDAVVPRRAGRPDPLCAIYRVEPVRARARARLEAGEYALRGLLDAVDTSYLEGADLEALDPTGMALENVNTPAELQRVETVLREAGRESD